jgi:SAM-dependent methyltransferase
MPSGERSSDQRSADERPAEALARLYDLDLAEDPGDLDLYLALAGRTGGPIAELAVGSGRLAIPLAQAGYEVVGIDHDPAMVARARRRWSEGPAGGSLQLVEADALDAGAGDRGRFRLAFIALNSILLFADPERQAQVVARLADLVGPGGLVAVDAWQPQPMDLVNLDGRLSLEWLRDDPETGRTVTKLASGWYDPATRGVTLTTLFDEAAPGSAVQRWTRLDSMRLAAADELVRWAEAAGLEVEMLAGEYGMTPYGSGSDRAVLIARKPG